MLLLLFKNYACKGSANRAKYKIKRVIFCLFERDGAYIVRKFMGVSWELLGSCLGFTDLAEKRKKQGWPHPECIPNASRMFFFALQIIFFGGNVRTFSQKNRIFAI